MKLFNRIYILFNILLIFIVCVSGLSMNFDLDYNESEAIKYAKFAKFSECDVITFNSINTTNSTNSTNLTNLTVSTIPKLTQLTKLTKQLLSNSLINNDCVNNNNENKLFFSYKMVRLTNYTYKFKIFYNDDDKTIIISFKGPSINKENNVKYIQHIYNSGWKTNEKLKYKIEQEFNLVYFYNLRKVLLQKMFELKKSGREKYLFYFTGHSIGGSLAVLAAYDLVNLGLIKTMENLPTVYTYGMLRIGDQNFIRLVDNSLYIYKIMKINDFAPRIPICYKITSTINANLSNLWRCFHKSIVKKHLLKKSFPISGYTSQYRWNWNNNNILLKKFSDLLGLLDDIFYTQPLGKYILYNNSMTKYKYCQYKKEMPVCEEFIDLPNNFSMDTHKIYFNLEFK